jgi:acyl carrier protein
MSVEDRLDIEIPEEDLTVKVDGKDSPRFKNLGEFADYVVEKVREKRKGEGQMT